MVAPVWNVIYSIGLLMGIGGSVIFSTKRGSGMSADGEDEQYFTAAVIGSAILAALAWVGLILFERPLLMFFGTDETLLALAQRYMIPVKVVFPLFLFNRMLAAFLRNDGAPHLRRLVCCRAASSMCSATGSSSSHAIWAFTALGSAVSFLVMLTHFASRKNTLRLVKPKRLARKLWKIAVTGFSSFFIDMAMGILTVLFNRQIMQYLGSDALAIYGPIINVSTFVQCCAYSVGQASQPIISTNFGAGKEARIRETLRYALWTVVFFGVFWTVPSVACPNLYIRIFMSPTETILAMAPAIIRTYAISFLLLPFNIFSTYYFQAILQPKAAFIVSVARGLVISGALILMLPLLAGTDSLWFAMPITELVTAVYAAACIRRYTARLDAKAT